MAPDRIAPLARAVAALLSRGLDPDAQARHFLASTFGTTDPEALSVLAADPDSHEGALLCGYLLFPGPGALALLEEPLAAASLSPAEVPVLAASVAQELAPQSHPGPPHGRAPGDPFPFPLPSVAVRLPSGTFPLPLTPESLLSFVARLRPERTPPLELSAALDRRLPRAQALAARAVLRQGRLAFSPPQTAFLRSLIDRLSGPGQRPDPRFDLPPLPGHDALPAAPPAAPPALPEVLAYASALLERAEPGEPPLSLLARRARELDALLRQAERLDAARSQGSFEFLSASGLRAPHLHAPDLRRELSLLDAASRAVTGRSAQSLDAPVQRDLGLAEDFDDLLSLL